MKQNRKHYYTRIRSVLFLFVMVVTVLSGRCETVSAKSSIYDNFRIQISASELTVYTGMCAENFYTSLWYSYAKGYSDAEYKKAMKKINDNLIWTSSDPSVVGFYDTLDSNNQVKTVGKQKGSFVSLYGITEGTATVTVKSALIGQSYKCRVTVKNAELTCADAVYYAGNTYRFTMAGNAAGVNFSSSDTSVAKINAQTGTVKTLKAGKCTLSCVADDEKTYKYKLKVQHPGLNYTTLTTYYYTGLKKGFYTNFPLVAKGIDVKSWASSNTKVCKVEKQGALGILSATGVGKCTITCTAKNGKKYTCRLTVVGGKKWGGLNNGFRPKLSDVKKHGYIKDINTVQDYGTVIVILFDMDDQIKWNRHKKLDSEIIDEQRCILQQRYPDRQICVGRNDLVLCRSDNGKQYGRPSVYFYYVK
ncbi:MAG: Ig domain-containing protein [Agathobacter sp.]